MPTRSPNDHDVGGFHRSDTARARPIAFFGWIVIERLWENENGAREWRRIRWPEVFALKPPRMMEG